MPKGRMRTKIDSPEIREEGTVRLCNECDSLGHALIKFSGFIFRREIWMQALCNNTDPNFVVVGTLHSSIFLVDTFLAIYMLT